MLAGWGNHPRVAADVVTPDSSQALLGAFVGTEPLVSRGLGRAYGDAALPASEGGKVLSSLGIRRLSEFDPETGVLVASAGVSLEEIIETFLPRGWFLPTVPGTKYVTLGGAVAADIHGKNHHVDGTLGAHVLWLELLTPARGLMRCSPSEHGDVFRATVGGMGLTGHIMRLALRLRKVPSAWCKVRTIRSRDLAHALALLGEHDLHYRHTVAWVDGLARGDSLGRSVLMLGNEAEPEDLPASAAARPHQSPRRRRFSVPFDWPSWALGTWSVRLFNACYYGLARDRERLVDFEKFFFPLDSVAHWNRAYGARGFVQFQAFFPDATAEAGLRACLEAISLSRQASFLAVLKRSGPANGFLLSFLDKGYTLALDLPADPVKMPPLMRELEAILLRHRGRIYFAKDAYATAAAVAAMYPSLPEFRDVKARLDPAGRLRSRLSERLKLHE